MDSIRKCIDKINLTGHKSLTAFLTAGYPNEIDFFKIVQGIVNEGIDILEIGIPFSDPLADGPIIQESSFVTLQNGVSITGCIKMAEKIKNQFPNLKIVFMGYANPIHKYGKKKFANDSLSSGVSGLIVPDIPLEEYDSFFQNNLFKGLDLIQLTTPTSSDDRIKLIDEKSNGFVYCVSITGVTGNAKAFNTDTLNNIKRTYSLIRKNKMQIGFGISSAEDLAKFKDFTDGFIVGSAIIKAIKNSTQHNYNNVFKLVKTLKNEC